MKIIICEDQKILLDGLVSSLSKEPTFEIVSTIDDSSMILKEIKRTDAEIVLTDIITKNKKNSLEYIQEIKTEFPNIKIVTITGFPDISFMEKAKKVGVNSFVYKNISTDELIGLIKNTLAGYSVFPSDDKTKDLMLSSLNEIELKILRLYCAGNEREEIAKLMFMSLSSLKSHISSILQKTGFSSIARVAIYAIKNGLIVSE